MPRTNKIVAVYVYGKVIENFHPNIVLSSIEWNAWSECCEYICLGHLRQNTISLCNYLRWELDKTKASTNWFLVSENNIPYKQILLLILAMLSDAQVILW